MTLTATLPQRKRDPREVATLDLHFAEKVERFEQCVNLRFSNDDIGRYYSKECLVEIALYYMRRREDVEADAYADYIELENEELSQ
jgi:hypothetical protein